MERKIAAIGVLVRVFGRGKSESSLRQKIDSNPGKYSLGGRLVQDSVGIRVVVYFFDDTPIVEDLLKRSYEFLPEASSIDVVDEFTFNVVRRNLVFRLPPEYLEDVRRLASDSLPLDTTFEVQIRSVLSEGWHEVEHDQRYKCRDNWRGHADLNRALNGVIAALESSEWSMLRIFDELAFRHYRTQNWAAMSHAKLRIRAQPQVDAEILRIFDANNSIPRALYKFTRAKIFDCIVKNELSFPVNISNFIYLWNWIDIRNSELLRITPDPIGGVFGEISS